MKARHLFGSIRTLMVRRNQPPLSQPVRKGFKAVPGKQAFQSRLRKVQVRVVAKPRLELAVDSGLVRVYLPRVQIEHQPLAFFLELPEGPIRISERKDSQITASGRRNIDLSKLHGGGRKFQ